MRIKKIYQPYQIKIDGRGILQRGKQKYFCFASRETCFCRDEIWISWLIDHDTRNFIDVPDRDVYDYYLEEKSALKTLLSLAEYIQNYLEKHNKEYELRKKELVEYARKVNKVAQRQNRNDILKHYKVFIQKAYQYSEYIWTPWAVIYHLEKVVMKHFPEQVETVTALEKPIEFFRMQQSLWRLSLAALVKRYGWLNVYSPYDKPYTEADFKKLKKEINKNEIEKQLHQLKETKKAFAALLSSIKNRKLKKIVTIVHTYAFRKTDRVDAWRRVMYLFIPFYQRLALLVPGSTIRDMTNLSVREVLALLEKNVVPDIEHLKLRSANRTLYNFHKGLIEVIVDPTLISETLQQLQDTTEVKILHGITACKGRARGVVKIISHSKDLHKVKKGDIFVARYTFPSFTPIMAKCKAIVTDEGGLTSHAAVVSRELGIPCIIGTKVATKVLKTGDLVEVDANKGVVYKLK